MEDPETREKRRLKILERIKQSQTENSDSSSPKISVFEKYNMLKNEEESQVYKCILLLLKKHLHNFNNYFYYKQFWLLLFIYQVIFFFFPY